MLDIQRRDVTDYQTFTSTSFGNLAATPPRCNETKFEDEQIPLEFPATVPLHLRDNLYQLRYRRRRAQDAAAYAHQTPARYVVELCAGTSSAVKYHLLDDPHAVGLSIDLRSNEFLLKHVPPNLHARFTPVGSTDVEHLTYEKLADIVRKAWNISLNQVDVIHHSLMCQSLSGATCDRTNHFTPDKITLITTLA